MGAMLWRSVSTTNIFKLYFRNTLAFTGGFEISVDNLLLLQSLGVHYVGGEFFAHRISYHLRANMGPNIIKHKY